jgi:DMSO reductase family type II enzyme heme b subunit
LRFVIAILGVLFAVAVVVTVGRGSLVSAAQTDLRSVYIDSEIPIGDPESALWDDVPSVQVPLSGQAITSPVSINSAIDTVTARSLHNGNWIAFQFEWEDDTKDVGGRVSDFRDSVAIQLPLGGNEPFVCMGFADAAVNILHWRADFQRDIEDGVPNINDIFPNAAANIYPGEGDVAFSTGLAAGNPLSATDKPSPVEDLEATGFGTLETQLHSDVTGWGAWDGDKWKVVIARRLETPDVHDAQLESGKQMPVAFALWDGDNRDVDGRKSVSAWLNVKLDNVAGTGVSDGDAQQPSDGGLSPADLRPTEIVEKIELSALIIAEFAAIILAGVLAVAGYFFYRGRRVTQ